ncbi:MAG TPA: hypothetical protein VIK18_05910 [Pirellulales bacterium]
MTVAAFSGPACGATPAHGSTSRQAREDALRAIPLDKLPVDKRAKVAALLSDGSVFRRMPTRLMQCDPDFYAFLLEHPEVIVNIWSALGVSGVRLTRTSPDTLEANDGAGTSGTIEYLYRSRDTYLLYGDGVYTGAMFTKPVRGQCLLVLKSGTIRESSGRYSILCRLDAFMHLDHMGVDLLAKTFQPLIGPVADHNFRETVSFVESLNRAAEINYPGVHALVKKLDKISAQTRIEMARLTEQVAIRAALADARRPRPDQPPPLSTARRPVAKPAEPQNR